MAAPYYPRGVRPFVSATNAIGDLGVRLGHMLTFFIHAVVAVPVTLTRYRKAFLRCCRT